MIILHPTAVDRVRAAGRRDRGAPGWSQLRDELDRTIASITALVGPLRPTAGVTEVVARNAERADQLAGLAERVAARQRSRCGDPDTLRALQLIATALGQTSGELGDAAHALTRGVR